MSRILKLSLRLTLLVIILGWLSSCAFKSAKELGSEHYSEGYITDKKLGEASGIAVSSLNSDVLWIHNDSFSLPELYAIDSNGQLLATVQIEGIENIDWEDLAIFEHNSKSYIVIADVGDNYAERESYYLHIVQEPILKELNSTITIRPERTIEFVYEDGAKDSESVAVDPVEKKVLLLSKREEKPILYEMPLFAPDEETVTAKKLGDIPPFPNENPDYFSIISLLGYGAMPTAMDISADGRFVAVLTYTGAYLFERLEGETWLQAMTKQPKRLVMPKMDQAEAIGFSPDGRSLFITSERVPAPIVKIDLD